MLPNLSVFWVIFFVLILSFALDRLLLRPVSSTIEQREQAIASARALAKQSALDAKAAAAELEAKTAAARADVYREMDEMRRAALGRRAEVLDRARKEAEAEIANAVARLDAESRAARERLQAEADALGAAVAERLLGRQPS